MSKKQKASHVVREESGWLGSVLTIAQSFVVAFVAIGIYSHFTAGSIGTAQAADEDGAVPSAGIGVLVVDSKAVLTAYMDKVQARIASGEEFSERKLEASGASFGADYLRVLKVYRDQGYVVIDKKYALGVPKGVEVTAAVGEKLNLKVEVTPDPFSFVADE